MAGTSTFVDVGLLGSREFEADQDGTFVLMPGGFHEGRELVRCTLRLEDDGRWTSVASYGDASFAATLPGDPDRVVRTVLGRLVATWND